MAFAYPAPALRDDTVWLRPWDRVIDLPTVRAATADPPIPATTTVPVTYSEAAASDWVDRQDRRRRDRQGVVLAIALDDGPAVGMVGVTGVHARHQQGNLGYWVVPAHRRQGHARRAAVLLADWAFAGMGLVRLESRVAIDNEPSRRILQAIGFTLEGVASAGLRLSDAWVDMAMYARLRTAPPVPRGSWHAFRQGTSELEGPPN